MVVVIKYNKIYFKRNFKKRGYRKNRKNDRRKGGKS